MWFFAYARYIDEQALEDGVNFDLYICGMQPVEEGRPCHEIFQFDPNLQCSTLVEAEFYNILRPCIASSDLLGTRYCVPYVLAQPMMPREVKYMVT